MSNLGTIENILLEKGSVSKEAWQDVRAKAPRGSMWKSAVALGYLSEHEALKTISERFSMPYIEQGEFPDSSFQLEQSGIQPSFLSDNKIFPISLDDGKITAIINDPATIPLIESMFMGQQLTMQLSLATEDAIHHAIEKKFGSGISVMEAIVDRAGNIEVAGEDEDELHDEMDDLVSGAPVIKLVNLIIARAVESSASDIHIEPFEKELDVRYRLDGILHKVEAPPMKMQMAIISRIKIMARLDIAEKRLPQDGRIHTRIGGRDIDMRVSTIPTVYGESAVMRILDRESVVLSLKELGFPEKELGQFTSLIKRPYGMLLVTGPTGSGKTTTLYGALEKINKPDKKIITIEDPVEYQMNGINQIQVRPKIGLSFQDGLRSIVRQDPDIIMVGEIRDKETAEIAIQAALTGHLVFSTVHTNDSAGAITRLLDMGIEHYLISSALIGSLAQRLVRVLCKSCKKPYMPDAQTSRMVGSMGETIYQEAGCSSCADTGYRGRVGIYELLGVDDNIQKSILSKQPSHIIKEEARKKGMRTLREDGWLKVRQGVTSLSEVIRVTAEEVI